MCLDLGEDTDRGYERTNNTWPRLLSHASEKRGRLKIMLQWLTRLEHDPQYRARWRNDGIARCVLVNTLAL